MADRTMRPWWARAVYYQVYVRSFADSDGDGLGDLDGLRARLDHVASLGVDALWLNPFYPTPDADYGYDVADYCDVDPRFGTLDSFDRLLAAAHARGLRVVVDLVPNHTSDRHPWFVEESSQPAGPGPTRYIWADGTADGGPPNNWTSAFGGSAWTWHRRRKQWYLHLFDPAQPDLNWRNPQVRAAFDDILRFWLDRGVDGFRIDVAHGLFKDEGLRDNPLREGARDGDPPWLRYELRHTYDLEDVHDVYRHWRRLVDAYPGDRVLVGEAFLRDPVPDRVARYVRPDELHLVFAFVLLGATWDAAGFRRAIDGTLRSLEPHGAPATWVLSNHDVVRHATRYGGGDPGLARARAAILLLLALPGAVFVYQGEELGLEEVDLADSQRVDPLHRHGGVPGRDGCRVPMPWSRGGAPGYGFTSGVPWLPAPVGWGERSVEAQEADPTSILHLYRAALSQRASHPALAGSRLEWLDAPAGCLVFVRHGPGTTRLLCAVNLGEGDALIEVSAHAVGKGDGLVLTSDDALRRQGDRLSLPAGTAAWLG